MNVNKWDKHFLRMAYLVSEMSKDPSTQTGAVIVRPDRSVCSTGFNGFPRNMSDDEALYADREVKYDRVVHCEMNALLHSRDGMHQGYTLYTTPFLSCSRCAVHMLQAGIERFVAPIPTPEQIERWGDAFERTRSYFREAGVSWLEVDTEAWTVVGGTP